MNLFNDPMVGLIILAAGASGGLFGAIVAIWQSVLSRHVLRAQVRANELQAFTTMNLKFLDITQQFEEHINHDVGLDALSSEERRAIDQYFYLANMEFVLYKEKVIDEKLSRQWIEGIASAARKRPFIERWRSTASKFTLDPDFKSFFESKVPKS